MTQKRKILFVNNNMHIGGVQKSLCNLLKEISDDCEISLLLFSPAGEYMNDLPEKVKVINCKGSYKYLGISQGECKTFTDRIIRGFFAVLTRLVSRDFVVRIMNLFQKPLKDEYDFAISFLQNGSKNSFYGGCNDFVLYKTKAQQKITFLHCDYGLCGANYEANNNKYKKFDKIAACSDGCKNAFTKCVDVEQDKVYTVINCHDFKKIVELSNMETKEYDADFVNIVSVARLSQEKGIDRGIKAVHYAIKNGANIRYHIVGDGPKRGELQNLCDSLNISDSIVFYGNSDNPYRFMKNADLLLIPSFHEAAPLVIDEARCLGLPVLSTKTTSTEEMIIKTNSGWMCENNQDSLNQKLLEIVLQKNILKSKKQEMQNIQIDNSIAMQNFYSLIDN